MAGLPGGWHLPVPTKPAALPLVTVPLPRGRPHCPGAVSLLVAEGILIRHNSVWVVVTAAIYCSRKEKIPVKM